MTGIVRSWERFWFERAPTSTVALIRIAAGLVALFWTLSLAPDLRTFFTRTGIMPRQVTGPYEWGILRYLTATPVMFALYAMLLVASVCLIIGFHSRLASVIVFLGVLSFERRNAWIFNAGDGLVRILCFYVMLMPSGVALSVDRWRRAKERFWEFPHRPQWAVRLLQVQISVLYASTVWHKLRGTEWNDGTAVSYALRVGDYIRFRAPAWIWNNVWIVNVMTYATLAIEFSLAFLVWNKRARPAVLLAGVAMHIGIAINIQIGFFSMAVMAGYLAFIPPETATRWIGWARSRFARSRFAARRATSAPSEAASDARPAEAPGAAT